VNQLKRDEDLIYYLITDPQYYSNDVELFKKKLKEVLKTKKVDYACFRDKSSKNYAELALVFVKVCKKYGVKQILLNENISLAKKLKCGIHLTSKQFDLIKEAKEHDLYVVISCHDILQIEKAQKAYVNAVTYSPIFDTPNKGEAKGIGNLKKILSIFDMNIIALGGIINDKQIEDISNTKAYGFSSIRYFLS